MEKSIGHNTALSKVAVQCSVSADPSWLIKVWFSASNCRHIAMATIHKVDVLASWNFKHIVNLDRIKGYNSVNLRLGYSMIEIRSPKDLVNYGND